MLTCESGCIQENLKSIKEIYELISFSPFADRRANIHSMINENQEYFSGKVLQLCNSCNSLIEHLPEGVTQCSICAKCCGCGKEVHPQISCKDFHDLEFKAVEKSSFYRKPECVSHKDTLMLNKAVEILRNFNIQNRKIMNYAHVNPSGMQNYQFQLIEQRYPDLSHKYFLSRPYENETELDEELYEGVQLDENTQSYKFYRVFNLSNKLLSFILYKVFHNREIINRPARPTDKTDEPLIYIDNNYFYLTNIKAVVPFMIIKTEVL